ncbi:MAG: hypothetical protein RLZZ161_319 [Bacteroidota bacterium]
MDCQTIISSYLQWIKDNTVVKTLEEGKACSISTPFLDRHNDHLDIYLFKDNNQIKLTDNGDTINDLRMSGFEINTDKRKIILETTLNGFGVQMGRDDELFVDANLKNIGQKKHYLLQAILAVNDMFNLSQSMVSSLFKEDVEAYFRANDILFNKDVKLTGKSGYDYNIDFLIPASKSQPERLIKTINQAAKDTVLSAIMALHDIEQMRGSNTGRFVIYNDTDKAASAESLVALNNYGVQPIAWSEKQLCLEKFALN